MDWFHIFVLAQAQPGISDFARQIPVGLIAMFCGSGLALVGLTFLIVRARAARSQQAQQAQPTHYTVPPPINSTDMSDLPDLDALVSTPPPAPKAAPPPPAPAPSMPAARTNRNETYSVRPADGDATQAVEVVTILRDVVDGSLLIQMGDKTYRDPNNDATFKNSFVKIMRELGPVVRQEARPPQAPPPAATTPPVADSGSLRDLLVTEDEEDDAETPSISITAAPPPPTVDGQMPGDLPRFSLDEEPQVVKKRGGLLRRTKKEYAPVPELDLASAIEAYLQHKLRHSDQFHQRNIHIHPSPDGAVAIEVDGVFFESVGDVNEPDVRAFLAATIQEWQERNKR